jgi:hypothetical protein
MEQIITLEEFCKAFVQAIKNHLADSANPKDKLSLIILELAGAVMGVKYKPGQILFDKLVAHVDTKNEKRCLKLLDLITKAIERGKNNSETLRLIAIVICSRGTLKPSEKYLKLVTEVDANLGYILNKANFNIPFYN